jgi:hypothetical protein
MHKLRWLVLILLFSSSQVLAERAVQQLYLSQQDNAAPAWFKAYAQANYQTSFELLSVHGSKPPKPQFLSNAYIYANRLHAVKDAKHTTWGSDFYNQFPPSSVQFTDTEQVQLPLKRNLFVGKMGGDTVRIVLDTGGHGITVSQALVDKYNLPTDPSIIGTSYMPAFDRVSTNSPTIIKRLQFGGMELHNLRAEYTVSVEESGQFSSDQQYDIFMGLDSLIGLVEVVRFDWQTQQVTFSNSPLAMQSPQPFIFFDSKPITVLRLGDNYLTTVLDTGSPVDILNKALFTGLYANKEQKKYGAYVYHQYTVPITIQNTEFLLGVADYMEGFNLKLDGEKIDLIIGTSHRQLTIDLQHNRFELK